MENIKLNHPNIYIFLLNISESGNSYYKLVHIMHFYVTNIVGFF